MSKRGLITSTRTVHCYHCEASYTAAADASLRVAELEWMGFGWCRFNCGWYCPACVPLHMEWLRKRTEEAQARIHIRLRANGASVDAKSIGEVESAITPHVISRKVPSGGPP